MARIGLACAIPFFVLCVAASEVSEEPITITVCQLKNDPGAYNHRLIQVTGLVSHGFEDFTLFDSGCSSWPAVWLEYGGTTASGTIYCCGVTASRVRPKQLVVENIRTSLVKDARFREFDKLIHRLPESVVYATVVGRFFSGKQVQDPKGASWEGYGHLGCCSLFIIQRVISVKPQEAKAPRL